MKECKKCFSTNMQYVTNYEHLDFSSEDYVEDDGWLCLECECLHLLDGSYEYFVENNWSSNLTKASYG